MRTLDCSLLYVGLTTLAVLEGATFCPTKVEYLDPFLRTCMPCKTLCHANYGSTQDCFLRCGDLCRRLLQEKTASTEDFFFCYSKTGMSSSIDIDDKEGTPQDPVDVDPPQASISEPEESTGVYLAVSVTCIVVLLIFNVVQIIIIRKLRSSKHVNNVNQKVVYSKQALLTNDNPPQAAIHMANGSASTGEKHLGNDTPPSAKSLSSNDSAYFTDKGAKKKGSIDMV